MSKDLFVYVMNWDGVEEYWATRTDRRELKVYADKVFEFFDEGSFRVSKNKIGSIKNWLQVHYPQHQVITVKGTLMFYDIYHLVDPGELMSFRLRLNWDVCRDLRKEDYEAIISNKASG